MGKTKTKKAETTAAYKQAKVARKAAQAQLDGSEGASSSARAFKKPKLNNSSRDNNRNSEMAMEGAGRAFFPLGMPREGEKGERELDEAEKYLLSVR